MLNLDSIFNYILKGIQGGDERFVIIDDEHILDKNTGVKFHLYDGWFKITRNDEVVVEMDNLSKVEHVTLWGIKKAITDPVTMKEREDNYATTTKLRREKLSDLFEYPEPIMVKSPVMEPDTEEYTG